ncbi:uncharacterized protein N7477_006036 [Penicillium maclennaniae]|uniref:uncharacterized protein n=1 Tax=Penicillium maclennaniae TaxID=1343394 RepID=UPI002541B525|nr:uncharacterized protein N7477_006036 [Penicillium maclennaniae]KAJ5670673.1 hypothetical protein N7477_006036 [Penicillium maclennaniae]
MDQVMLDLNDPNRRRQPLVDASSRINHVKSPRVETPKVHVESTDLLKTPDRKRKTHVGPWQLGRTLGKGATGRVRLAKHAVTGQTAAIKIVSKKSAAMVQSESIAAMDRNVSNFSGFSNARHMPVESNVSLYDVWENRGELYLVLEYVEGGELFDYVSKHGPLPEEEAVRLFRQIIAGLGYCHRFNICHRDLKPENILLDGQHNVKLADFGMAALQPPGHWLNTSCGSPHYAAPEIIYGRKYRGDRADMWSCGIILYALLTGYLPFDGGDLPNTLRLVKKGDYMIPQELSDESADLIQRILQKRPEDRISMQNVWMHPYRHDIDGDILRNLQTLWHDVKPEALVDRIMCLEPTHERMFYNALVKFRDEQLENYQGQPLEYSASDYHHISRIGGKGRKNRSNSKRRSQISKVKDFHRRMGGTQEPKSCASVESYDPYRSPKNYGAAAEAKYAHITIHKETTEIPEIGEISSMVKHPTSIAEEVEQEESDDATESPFTVLQKRKHKPSSMKSFHSSKLAHSSSRAPGMSSRSTSYRRNVSFHHARNRSQSSTRPKRRKTAQKDQNAQTDLKQSPSVASLQFIAHEMDFIPIPSSPPLPAQPTVVHRSGLKTKTTCQEKRIRVFDLAWKEDARKVSHELSQICEEAFNGSSISTIRSASDEAGYETPLTPVSIASPKQHVALPTKPSMQTIKGGSKETGRSYSIQELTETRRKLVEHSKGRHDNIPAYLFGVIGHLDRLIEEDQAQHHKRSESGEDVPVFMDPFDTLPEALPVIKEEFASPVRGPVAPTPKAKSKQRPSAASCVSDARATIRMVPHSSVRSLHEVKPLMIRKKNQLPESDSAEPESMDPMRAFSVSSRQTRNACELEPIEEAPVSPKHRSADGKKWSWFKHRPQVSESAPALPPKDTKQITPSTGTVVIHTPPSTPPSPTKTNADRVPVRKSSMERFGGALKKLVSKKANKTAPQEIGKSNLNCFVMTSLSFKKDKEKESSKDQQVSPFCKGFPDKESSFEADDPASPARNKRLSLANHNWFARVFQIKPATRVIALNTSKVKGRKEVYRLLREWEDYGMEDVTMDKNNSIVRGRVGEVNFLRLREVEFTAEFYTVLEHGRQANLSLVRFKQERGAASTFNKVVDTMQMMLKSRDMIVQDPVRAKKMARVLESIPNA